MLFRPAKVAHEDLISPNEKTQVEVGYARHKMVKLMFSFKGSTPEIQEYG